MSLGTALLRSHRNKRDGRGGGSRKLNEDFSMKHDQTDINEFLDSKKYLEDVDPEEDQMSWSFPNDSFYQLYLDMVGGSANKISADHSRCPNPIYLTIPKRPYWDYSDDKETLLRKEAQCFTEWKRSIRLLEKPGTPVLCPYEKNIELWKQLWRVIERCDIIFKILDCRNPNVYRSLDLESDIRENKKMLIYVLNKADLINLQQREVWAEYFRRKGRNFIFFASETETRALIKNEDLNTEHKVRKERTRTSSKLRGMINPKGSVKSKEVLPCKNKDHQEQLAHKQDFVLSGDDVKGLGDQGVFNIVKRAMERRHPFFNNASISISSEVRAMLESLRLVKQQVESILHKKPMDSTNEKESKTAIKIGLVGFPNVGKSSFLNSLMCQKKVATSSRPGKTKYFQSLLLPGNSAVILHDSPGILFPSLSKDTGTALCEGKVCIETARNHEKHLIDVCKHVTFETLESKYKINLPHCRITRPEEFVDVLLTTYACSRGYLGTFNQPLKSVVALKMMQDFVKGSVVFASPPPLEDEEYAALHRVVKSSQKHSHKIRFEKVMNACERIYEIREIPSVGAKSPSKDFYIPIAASDLEEQTYLFYELYFNLWVEK